MIVGPPAHPPAAASVVSATAANVEDDLRHCEAHRSTCGGYAQQRFVHGNRELAGGGRFGAFSIPPPATPIPPRASSKCDGAMKKDAGAEAAAAAADSAAVGAAAADSGGPCAVVDRTARRRRLRSSQLNQCQEHPLQPTPMRPRHALALSHRHHRDSHN